MVQLGIIEKANSVNQYHLFRILKIFKGSLKNLHHTCRCMSLLRKVFYEPSLPLSPINKNKN